MEKLRSAKERTLPSPKMQKAELAALDSAEADREIQQADDEIRNKKYETYKDVESFVDELDKRAKRNPANQSS